MPLNAAAMSSAIPTGKRPMVRVWDIFVRTFHWSVVAAFFVAYFTEDEFLTLHVWAGYAIGGFLALRVIWGVVGPRHARFSDFIFAPATVLSYTRDLLAFRAKRYLGHSPAGGAMIVALLVGLAASVWSGLELYAAEEGKGPLAGTPAAISAPARAAPYEVGARFQVADRGESGEDEDDEREENGKDGDDEFWEEAHEILANLTLVLVVLHVGGVLLASVVHRENLARSMVTGLKRAEE